MASQNIHDGWLEVRAANEVATKDVAAELKKLQNVSTKPVTKLVIGLVGIPLLRHGNCGPRNFQFRRERSPQAPGFVNR